ncbi:MAG TPA: hypothetical protein VEA63_11945, partial [Opitutus sp.]|nr:hypothetical protein [Opitutus sp.]
MASPHRIGAAAKPGTRNWSVRFSSASATRELVDRKEARPALSPPLDQAYWRAPQGSTGGLQYLSWGARHFGASPVAVSRPGGWSYVVVEAGSPTLVWGGRREQIRGPALVLIGPDCGLSWRDVAEQENKHLVWVWRHPVHTVMARLQRDAVAHYALEAADVSELRHLHVLSRNEIFRGDLHSEAALTGLQSLLEARIARIGEG